MSAVLTPPRIPVAELRARLAAGATYLDVRAADEFEAAAPVGAINIPCEATRFVERVRAALPDLATPIIVGCEKGLRSYGAAAALLEAGYTDVVEFRAGFAGRRDPFGALVEAGWKDAGLPVRWGDED